MEKRRLEGKVAIVTGAASGIGEAIALQFAREGARLVLLDFQKNLGEELCRRIRPRGSALFVHGDLAEEAACQRVIDAAVKDFGGFDILVNNAAFYDWSNKKAILETPDEVWDRTLAVNLRSVFLLCKKALPVFIQRKGGSIINISSIGGIAVFPEFAAYSVSKAALIQLTKSIAVDYGIYNIRANAICPGAIDTPGNKPFIQDEQQYRDTISSVTPLNRAGSPEEVASAAVFLASAESSYVTAATLIVDGGRLALA